MKQVVTIVGHIDVRVRVSRQANSVSQKIQ